jgi:hypothetical protein
VAQLEAPGIGVQAGVVQGVQLRAGQAQPDIGARGPIPAVNARGQAVQHVGRPRPAGDGVARVGTEQVGVHGCSAFVADTRSPAPAHAVGRHLLGQQHAAGLAKARPVRGAGQLDQQGLFVRHVFTLTSITPLPFT